MLTYRTYTFSSLILSPLGGYHGDEDVSSSFTVSMELVFLSFSEATPPVVMATSLSEDQGER